MQAQLENVRIEVLEHPDKDQERAIRELQKMAFGHVSAREAQEDFYHPMCAQGLACLGEVLVGWAGIHESEQYFEGKRVKLGGYGICTHPQWEGKGIASRVSRAAMEALRARGVEVGFLSVDPSNRASVRVHEKNGFVVFPREFSWTNSKGEKKHDTGGMIAPINSRWQFDRILNGKDGLFIGNGYW